jgi:hypothetical protein
MKRGHLLGAGVAILGLALSSCDLGSTFGWVYAIPIQCGNPWDAAVEGPPPTPGSAAEVAAVRDFLLGLGIRPEELGFVDLGGVSCDACGCERGDLLVIRAEPLDAWKLTVDHGFFYLFSRPERAWLAKPLLQCGDDWQRPGEPQQEEAEFRQWAAEQGIAVSAFGLLDLSYPPPVCFGCGCPRGDRALVGVPDHDSERLLAAQGFTSLFE